MDSRMTTGDGAVKTMTCLPGYSVLSVFSAIFFCFSMRKLPKTDIKEERFKLDD